MSRNQYSNFPELSTVFKLAYLFPVFLLCLHLYCIGGIWMLFSFKLYTIKQEDELSHVHNAKIFSPKSRYNDFYRYDVWTSTPFFVIYMAVTIDLVHYYIVSFCFYFFQFYWNGIM